ncbi:hypothetical protein NBT05_08805 [Aquimarina sp. ERC-38]|uniref:DUF6695 family protein n=1 Tax=Aquimarina sp. ERC-38 TaxID=2949996 RepID=UPI002246402A|nr:DUF6695 family protein [Aquimarina sp. ERC-38]UZO82562.1 hypothetical protein NBT05_08805 [Aquimarina sp. ERC-38]
MSPKNKVYTGKIIVLAFPDTFVQFSHEKVARLLPLVGLGRKGIIKAGHAAFILIENKTGNAFYYDFGRYITPFRYGRVRSAETDVELHIPFKAEVNESGKLENLNEFLLWLEAHPEKTHGNGRLIASVCSYIDFQKAFDFVTSLQDQGSILYYTFKKKGTNCSRIVTDTILAATQEVRIIKPLLRNKKFTPSPLGNVEKGSMGSPIYKVENGSISHYNNKVLKENITNYFKRQKEQQNENSVEKSQEIRPASGSKQLLTGIGSSAYFEICPTPTTDKFIIKRYTDTLIKDFEGIFIPDATFFIEEPYEFTYDSHCKYCHIIQKEKTIKFNRESILFPIN